VLAGLAIDVAFQTLLPLSLKFLIDRAIEPGNRTLLAQALAALTGGVLVAATAMVWRDYLYARLGASTMQSIRQRQFEHLQTLSLDFFARTRPGDLLARFSTDLSAVETVVVGALPNTFSAALSLVLLGIALAVLDTRLTAITAFALPLCLIGPRILLPRAAARGIEARRLDADVLASVQENLTTQTTVKALGLEEQAIAKIRVQLERSSLATRRFNFLSYLAERTPNITVLLFHVGILAFGAWLAFDQKISIGTLVAFNALLLNLSAAVASLTSNVPAMLQAAAGMHRIREVLDERPNVVEAEKPVEMKRVEQGIRLEKVGFERNDKRILDDVNFEIRRGWSVALVGPSGCGKSSVLRLLARFADPTAGRVLLDGNDLKLLDRESLRRRTGIVLQQTDLFDATVRENIRCARPEATDAQIEEAVRLAEAEAFVRELGKGYDTSLGAGGPQLSGGQRQRLAIARALVRDPDILLLDEATSALDPATERSLNQTFQRLRGKHTIVSVTHRLGDAHEYDRIFVLDAGKLVEEGTHAELVERGGIYARMVKKQSGVVVSDNLEDASVSVEWLGDWPLFETANPWLLEEMTREFVTSRAAPGEQIIAEGMPGDRFFIIARGTVSVRRDDMEIAKLHDGDAFGEAALLSNEPRNASVFSLTDCVFLTLERSRFQRWLARDHELRNRMQSLAGKRD
jgi:ATP-binding cassette subfamily B protein